LFTFEPEPWNQILPPVSESSDYATRCWSWCDAAGSKRPISGWCSLARTTEAHLTFTVVVVTGSTDASPS